MAARRRAKGAFRKFHKRPIEAEITTPSSRRGAVKYTNVFVGPKASESYLGREAERMSEELDEVTPTAIYVSLPKVKHVKGIHIGQPSRGDSELMVADLSGKLTPLKVHVEGAAFGDVSVTDKKQRVK